MFNYLIGEVAHKGENLVVLENNGVGFEIRVSMSTLEMLPIGSVAKIFTFMNVREDEISLYGFANLDEKEMFLKLIGVTGIGPRVALTILSSIRLSDLAVAIKTEDIKLLCTIKGLGRKTAERIVLELKDKIELIGYSAEKSKFEENFNTSAVDEATEALISLGVNRNEAYRLARENAKGCTTSEEIIRKTFQNLNI